MLPKDDEKKKDAGKSAKKDKDPVNKSGARSKRSGPNAKFGASTIIVLFDKVTYDKLYQEVPNSKKLFSKGLIKLVPKDIAQVIYTRNTKGGDSPATDKDA